MTNCFSSYRLITVLALGVLILGLGGFNPQQSLSLFGLSEPVTLELKAAPDIPISKQIMAGINPAAVIPTASISAQAIYVYDLKSQTELYQKNADQPHYIASLTKMMTALVIKEALNLDEIVTIQKSDLINSNKVGFVIGERLTVDNLFKAMLITSSNEATEALARSYPGGYYALVNNMNIKAKQLGLITTEFTNPIGYDHSQHLSTAKEVAVISRELMQDPYLASIVGQTSLVIEDLDRLHAHQLQNTNELLSKDPRIHGIKTGTTNAAGEVLSVWFEVDDHAIQVVVLSSKERFIDVPKLIEWIQSEFVWHRPEQLMGII